MSEQFLSEQLLNAETGVLGSMLIDPSVVGSMLMTLADTDFQTPERQHVFQAFRRRFSAGQPVDALLIADDLGPAYRQLLADMIALTPTSANAGEYAAALKRTSRLLRLRSLGDQLEHALDEESAKALVDQANMLFCQRGGVRRLTLEQGYQEFFIRHDPKAKPDYLHWGLGALDDEIHVGGGDMVVIGGYPSAGKTALALQLVFRIARDKRVGFFSYETSADKLHDRTIACQAETSFRRIMTGTLDMDDYQRVNDMRTHLTAPVLDMIEAYGMTVSSIGSYAMANHYDVIVVDYLQKIPAPRGGRYFSDFDRVSQVSNDLQQLGRNTGKVVIALSQLSRLEKGQKHPTMSSLRQSGQIEQDADVVMLLYREYPEDPGRLWRILDVAKNKDGESSVRMLLDFDGDKQRFRRSNRVPAPLPVSDPPAQQSIFRPLPDSTPSSFDGCGERRTSG